MKILKSALVILLLSTCIAQTHAETEAEAPFRIQKLSDRVLLLTEISPMENIIIALNSQKGLVVVDVTGSPYTAGLVRKIVEKEFGRNDFAYVINTHYHWDHAWGNQVFNDVTIVGHDNCVEALLGDEADARNLVSRTQGIIQDLTERLQQADAKSEEAENLRADIAFRERLQKGLAEGFVSTPPSMTFTDRLTLNLGDMTLKLFYFGRAHSIADILIQIPEEELLLTGDLFLDIGWLPLFAGQPILDIPRWIDVLSTVLDGEDNVSRVIPGHRKPWSREKFELWRHYIVDLWTGVNRAKDEGLTFDQVLARFPLGPKFDYLKELGHTEERLQRYQSGNVEAFWRQLFVSAATVVELTLDESGIEEAKKKYEELKQDDSQKYFFGESEFNRMGYRLMGQGKIKEAIEIFKLNVEAYPDSWNVYDSLAEAYMNDGQTDLAIIYYKKSLELNPENKNAEERIRRLEEND